MIWLMKGGLIGATIGKFKEKSCRIIVEVIYLTRIFTPRAKGGRRGAFRLRA
jgi:hypothetical protein